MPTSSTKRHTDIAVIGGGFGGIYATRALTKQLAKSGIEKSVTIISDDNHLVFQPMLPEVAGSALSPRHVVNSIRHLCQEATVLKGAVIDIDCKEKTLTLEAGSFVGNVEVSFDQLVVSLGSHINLSMIPGMQEHAFLIQNVGDAMLLRATIISRFEEANLTNDPEIKRRLLSFVFVGGGYSGVETAGQVLDLGKAMCRYYKGIKFEDCTFSLIHSGEVIFPTAYHTLGEYTQRELRKRGLKILLSRRVSAVTANRVHLNDGSIIESNTVLCAVGNAPHPLLKKLSDSIGAPLERGRLKVENDGSVSGIPWLWGVGDCTSFPFPKGGPCPPTAQFATRQGSLVGKNLALRIGGNETKPFTFEGLGELAAVGHRTAVAEIRGLRFSGFLAWWMWRTIYLAKLPGLDRKLRVIFEWTLELFFPRDLTLLSPKYSSEVSETYLTEGDALFHKGDPAFSFYVVKKGRIEIRSNGQIIKSIAAGQHFGERALLDDGYYRGDAVATEPTVLVNIGQKLFRNLVQADETFSETLQRSAATYLSEEELARVVSRMPESVRHQNVADLMSANPIHFTLDQTVASALEQLKGQSRNYMPVVDAKGVFQFVVKKESLYLRLQSSERELEETIGDLPRIALPIVKSNDSCVTALKAIARSGYTKAIVLSDQSQLEGVIAIVDVFSPSRVAAQTE